MNEKANTYLGDWLSLTRIQSTPVSVLALSAGYITVEQTVLSFEILPLILVGVLGHWGFYGLNDFLDYREDLENKRSYKPLTTGRVTRLEAFAGITFLISTSIFFASVYFDENAFYMYLSACLFGLVYNIRSKRDTFSGLYLTGWAVAIVSSGGLYAGGGNLLTVSIAGAVGVHMLIMTIEGDIKDFNADEPSIPKILGCVLEVNDGEELIKTNGLFRRVFSTLEVVEMAFLLSVIVLGGMDAALLVVFFALTLSRRRFGKMVTESQHFDDHVLKKKIVGYTGVSASMMMVSLAVLTGVLQATLLIVISIGWGMMWQKIQYGSVFYFP